MDMGSINLKMEMSLRGNGKMGHRLEKEFIRKKVEKNFSKFEVKQNIKPKLIVSL